VFVTNAVKHFKWRASGKRRLPDIVVVLGATAAQVLLGPAFRVTRQRGRVVSSPLAPRVVATVHPSSILRAPDQSRDDEMRAFVRDLRIVAKLIG
jgi:uracil-DNA glycosylase family 4